MNIKKNKPQKIKTPWPTKEAMEQVYNLKLWGTNAAPFYSGEGSHLPEIIDPYIDAVSAFLAHFKNPLTLCDLGCGDFNIGKHLLKFSHMYHAIDIVPHLIAHNKTQFKLDNLKFHCLDLATDTLPNGDCALLRQVLQHLSNAEVQRILNKLVRFKYVIITDHIPVGNFKPNSDIISGQGIRIKKRSGLDVTAPPFGFQALEEKILVSTVLANNKGLIVTTLYTLF